MSWTLCAVLALTAPQQPDQERALESFRALRTTQKAMLIARVTGRIAASAHPALARIQTLQVDLETLPEAEPIPVFDPQRWARGVAPPRTIVPASDPACVAVATRFARTPFLPDLHAEVSYDWCRGEIVQRGWPLDHEERFENLLAGYAPGADHAVARVLAGLDVGEDERKLAWWFEHAYADLSARVFEGVTLYDAWYSGEVVDVPDVDAIPFAHEVLGRRSMRSPLSGRPRDRLYEAIQECALVYRKHRTTREAAAAAFVRADPPMDETYARLVPRFHYLFSAENDSLERIRELLAKSDRDALVSDIDRRVSDPEDDAHAVREARRAELAELATLVRETALAELAFFAR